MKQSRSHLPLVYFLGFCMLLSTTVSSDLVISKLDRQIDLSSQIVRTTVSLKVQNNGDDAVSEILLPFPEHQAKNLAFISAVINEGKGKTKSHSDNLPIKDASPAGLPHWYSITLPNALGKGSSLTLEVKSVFTNLLRPFPEKITQADVQLVAFQDSAHFLSPYAIKVQSLTIKLLEPKVKSYTKLENAKFSGSKIKYGPYENTPSFSYLQIVVHFVSFKTFTVAQELVREIEISHWGNVQITENFNLVHGGAELTGEFSRLDYQARTQARGASALRNLIAKLPPRAHSIYYRDEIGNISTSNVWSDSAKTLLEIEPRYPLFGGWRASFSIGYGLPLKDFLFQSEGKRFLNISFGCPVNDIIVENLTVKVVLPEGSEYVSASVPFPVKQSQEMDMVGRPVIVLGKTDAVPEHNQHFQVYYKFSNLSLLTEPIMLIFGFFLFFVACIVYTHADFTISKSKVEELVNNRISEQANPDPPEQANPDQPQQLPLAVIFEIARRAPIETLRGFICFSKEDFFRDQIFQEIRERMDKLLVTRRLLEFVLDGQNVKSCFLRLSLRQLRDPVQANSFMRVLKNWRWCFGVLNSQSSFLGDITRNLLLLHISVIEGNRDASDLVTLLDGILARMNDREVVYDTLSRLKRDRDEMQFYGQFVLDITRMSDTFGFSLKYLSKYRLQVQRRLLNTCIESAQE